MKRTTTQIIAKEGWIWLGVFGFLTLFFLALEWNFAAFLFLVLLGSSLLSYYNPERIPDETGENLLLAPVDGVVKKIEKRDDACVVTIHSPLCMVGILRMPLEGLITLNETREGLRPLRIEKSVREGIYARGELGVQSRWGALLMRFSPVLFEENLYLYPKPDSKITQGARVGFFKHGHLEMVLPSSVSLKVCEGDTIKGGETLLGSFPL